MTRLFAATLLLLASPQDAEKPLYTTSYRVINVHTHYHDPLEEAVKAQIEVMDRVGASVDVNLDAGRSDGTLPGWIELQKKYPGRFLLFAKFTLKDFARVKEPAFFEDMVRELERQAAMGIQGVKIWKDLGMYIRDESGKLLKLDDPRMDRFFARCGELGLPILIHSADPKEYWYPLTYNSLHYGHRTEQDQHYNNPEMPSWEELIRQRDALLARHPKTTFIGAHFGSLTFDLQKLAETLDRYPNFHVECAARLRILGRLNPEAVRGFFTKYQDRLLFGTDGGLFMAGRKTPATSKNISIYPVDDPNLIRVDPADAVAVKRWKERQALFYSRYFEYFETDRLDLVDPSGHATSNLRLRGAKLPKEILEKFYHGNAERLIPALKPK